MDAVLSPVEAIVDALARHDDRHHVLLFDFDGTLAEFADDPDNVVLQTARARLLEAIASRPGVTLGIVSGRQLETLRRRAPVRGAIFYAGLHGLEIAGPGVGFQHPGLEAGRATIEALRQAMSAEVVGLTGVGIENKIFGFTVHWRRAGGEARDRARAAFERLIVPLEESGEVYVQPGFDHADVIPNVRWNKGAAVRWIVDRVAAATGRPVWPMFVGDDLTDEHAFEAIGDDGVTVVVGVRPSSARHRLADPVAVEQLLQALADPP